MEKVVRKFAIGSEPKDAAFWRQRTPAERLTALETIRREYHLCVTVLNQDFKEFLAVLVKDDVRYSIVGGYSVALLVIRVTRKISTSGC